MQKMLLFHHLLFHVPDSLGETDRTKYQALLVKNRDLFITDKLIIN